MDQGITATLKKKYSKRMLNMARIKAKTAMDVQEIIRYIKIFDAIINAKVAWEAIDPETIAKCFRRSSVHHKQPSLSPPPSPTEIDKDPSFAKYFEELLVIPWDQYLAMDDELQAKNPARAPDALAYNNENTNEEMVLEDPVLITHKLWNTY